MIVDASSAAAEPLSVFMRPAWAGENALCQQMADALTAEGLVVTELGYSYRAVPAGPGIAFFHWPNEMFLKDTPRKMVATLMKLARMAWAKRQGLRLVWLAHNIVPHEAGEPFRLARSLFFHLLDGVVYLSESSQAQVITAYPALAEMPSLIVPHGVYLPRIQAPRPANPLATRPVHLVFAGRVKRYKAPDALAKAVASLPAEQVRVTIAGACDDPVLAAELTAIAAETTNIALSLEFLDDDSLESLLDSADAIVIPYRGILNSGSALHALSRARPFIAPRLGSLTELEGQVGNDWVWLYEGQLDQGRLSEAVSWLRRRPEGRLPNLAAFQWPAIGASLAGFLREIGGRPKASALNPPGGRADASTPLQSRVLH